MDIFTIQLGGLMANCHIVRTSPETCVALDIGGDSDFFLKFLNRENLKLDKILLTHGHFDHMCGAEAVRLATGAEVFVHENDADMLSSPEKSLYSDIRAGEFCPVTEFSTLKDGDTIKDGELSFQVLHTPGHSKGSVCYICDDRIFSGDTLFRGSIGRTDFMGSSVPDMKKSLRKINSLDGDFRIYTGHGESTTLEYERKNNPYILEYGA